MKYKLKNGSKITTIDATDASRSEVKYVSEITTIDTTDASRSQVKYIKARDEEIRDFYHRHPDKFVEDMCGIKLKWYQKIWFRLIR